MTLTELRRFTLQDKNLLALALFVVLVTLVLPGLNAWSSPAFFLHVSDFHLNLWGKYLCYAVLAISVNWLWGYTGLLCLGQCLFLRDSRFLHLWTYRSD